MSMLSFSLYDGTYQYNPTIFQDYLESNQSIP